MLNPGSYFPPVHSFASRLPSPAAPAPIPLLPTPIPTAAPTTLGGTLNEVPPHVVDLDETPVPPPTCSCPISDTCIAESLALLLGSFELLYRAVLEYGKTVEGQEVLADGTATSIAMALSRFEVSMKKLLGPVLECLGVEMETLLLQEWLRPIQSKTIDEDVCTWIRKRVDALLIEVVDTFPPLQHNLHMLLVRYEFGSSRFQAILERLKGRTVDSRINLLLEANRHLAQFSVKSDSAYKESLLDDLRCLVDGIVRQVERCDLGPFLNDHKS